MKAERESARERCVGGVLPDGLEARFLADGLDVGTTDLIGTGNEILKINIFTKVHLGSRNLSNNTHIVCICIYIYIYMYICIFRKTNIIRHG